MQVRILHPGIQKGDGPLDSAIVCATDKSVMTLRGRYFEGMRKSQNCRIGGLNPVTSIVVCIAEIYHDDHPPPDPDWWSTGATYTIEMADPDKIPSWPCAVSLMYQALHFEEIWQLDHGVTHIFDSFIDFGDPAAAAAHTVALPLPLWVGAEIEWTEEGDPMCSE